MADVRKRKYTVAVAELDLDTARKIANMIWLQYPEVDVNLIAGNVFLGDMEIAITPKLTTRLRF